MVHLLAKSNYHNDRSFSNLYYLQYYCLPYLQCVWFLSGILVSIPPAYGIRCYSEECRGSNCTRRGNIECSADDDRCGHLTYTAGSSVQVSKRNCTRSTIDCNEKRICLFYEMSESTDNNSVANCSMDCCRGNLCNAPGKEEGIGSSTFVCLFFQFVFTMCHIFKLSSKYS